MGQLGCRGIRTFTLGLDALDNLHSNSNDNAHAQPGDPLHAWLPSWIQLEATVLHLSGDQSRHDKLLSTHIKYKSCQQCTGNLLRFAAVSRLPFNSQARTELLLLEVLLNTKPLVTRRKSTHNAFEN